MRLATTFSSGTELTDEESGSADVSDHRPPPKQRRGSDLSALDNGEENAASRCVSHSSGARQSKLPRYLLIALCSLMLGCPPSKKINTPQALPQTQVQASNGEQVSLTAVTQGKVAVIDLWATWCEPCKETLPKLERLAKAYGPAGLLVLGVDVGEEDFSAVQLFAQSIPVTYPLYFDPSFAFVDSIGSTKVPTLLVLDRSGRIVHRSASLDEVTLQIIKKQLSPP